MMRDPDAWTWHARAHTAIREARPGHSHVLLPRHSTQACGRESRIARVKNEMPSSCAAGEAWGTGASARGESSRRSPRDRSHGRLWGPGRSAPAGLLPRRRAVATERGACGVREARPYSRTWALPRRSIHAGVQMVGEGRDQGAQAHRCVSEPGRFWRWATMCCARARYLGCV